MEKLLLPVNFSSIRRDEKCMNSHFKKLVKSAYWSRFWSVLFKGIITYEVLAINVVQIEILRLLFFVNDIDKGASYFIIHI